MILDGIQSVYRSTLAGMRITEWSTLRDERSNKVYHHSRTYTVHLYTPSGRLEEYNRPPNIDIRV